MRVTPRADPALASTIIDRIGRSRSIRVTSGEVFITLVVDVRRFAACRLAAAASMGDPGERRLRPARPAKPVEHRRS
ncbi:hypothetical protein ACFQY7_37955 [Actinomadura luteofluorescens]|uniref:hypothetical protein n=1 Tax=Actinomadura luteofluorescens TaxID=46163 RepID=UPI003645DECD